MIFSVGDKEYEIGKGMFPLSDSSQMKVFDSSNTLPYINEHLNQILDSNEFEVGHCYTNTEKVRLICEKLGVASTYYSGWVFVPGPGYPIHHAWSVIDGVHVIDMGMSPRMIRFQKKIEGDPNWRQRFAEETARVRSTIRRSKDCVMGAVPEGVRYVGSPDSMEPSKKIYRDTIKKFPKHISYYSRKGDDPMDATDIQKRVWALQGKVPRKNK